VRPYKFFLFTFLILLLLLFSLFGQNNAGAKQIALANSNIALENNVFAIFNNPAGLGLVNSREFGIYYSPSPFGIKELSNAYLAYLEPSSFGNLSIGAYTYGFELYRENQLNLAYSTKFSDNIYLGLTTFYHSVHIDRYGNSGVFNIKIGGIFILNQNFSLGFSLHNPLRFNKTKIELPLIYLAGFSYTPIKNSSLNFAVVKEMDFPVSVKFGIEYEIIEYLQLRVGTQNEPDIYSGGIGIFYSFMNLNYAITSHPELELSHQVDLIITF
jgi:hypothetical protein